MKTLAVSAALLALAACDKADDSLGPAASSGLITVTSPRAGSTWKIGDSLEVDWTVNNEDPNKVVDAVGVSLSPDGGANWGALHSNSISPPMPGQTNNWGRFRWKIADSIYIADLNKKLPLENVKTCRIKVEQYTPTSPDMTVITGDFTIKR